MHCPFGRQAYTKGYGIYGEESISMLSVKLEKLGNVGGTVILVSEDGKPCFILGKQHLAVQLTYHLDFDGNKLKNNRETCG